MDSLRRDDNRAVFVYNTASYLIRFRSELIRELQNRGYECHAALPRSISPEENETLAGMGVTVHPIENFVDQRITPIADVRLTLEYYRLYRKLKPKLVFNFTIKPCIYSAIAARWAGVPTIAAMITGLGYVFTETSLSRRIISFVAGLVYRIALRSKVLVYFQNTDDYRYFVDRQIVASENSVLINGSGVDLDAFRPVQRNGNTPVFLMVARLLKDKGVMEYLEACRLTKQAIPHARFMLVGPFDHNPSGIDPKLLQPYVDAGVVEYRGYLPNPLVAYHEATIYVLPSYYREGRPRTVLEAMACALAVITTEAPGCRETIDHGVNGYLVPPRSASALSQRMIELAKDPARVVEMSAASRRIAEERYDVRQITAKICERVCGPAGGHLLHADALVGGNTAAVE